MADNNIVEKVEAYAKTILENDIPDQFVYHDHYHTERVVKAAEVIGKECGFEGDDIEVLTIAAWFHDIGYINGVKNHEESSVQIAKDFLKEKISEKEQKEIKQQIAEIGEEITDYRAEVIAKNKALFRDSVASLFNK